MSNLSTGMDELGLYDPLFPADWRPHSLHSLADWLNGMAFRNIQFTDHGLPVIKIAEIKNGISEKTKLTSTNYDECYRVKPGDMLFSWSGHPETSIDTFWWRGPEGWLNQHIFKVANNASICSQEFLYYLLKYLKPNFIGVARNKQTTGLGHVTKADLKRFSVRVPLDHEQAAIVGMLKPLDDKIDHNWRAGRALEELARATFKAWFVDFEPVTAKAQGATSFPGMPPAAFDSLPDRLTDSPLGPVPEGWDTPAFSEIVKQTSERVGTASVPAYSSTNEGLRPRDEQFKKDLAKSFAKNLLIRSGDLVFGNSREILNFGVLYEPAGSVSQVYKVFRPHSEVVTPRYIEMMIRECSAFYRQIIRSTTRDNQGIMADFFLQLPLLVPPQEFRDAYAAVEKPVREMIDHLQAESAKLAALRDYLLPRLLSGQVRVRSSQGEVK